MYYESRCMHSCTVGVCVCGGFVHDICPISGQHLDTGSPTEELLELGRTLWFEQQFLSMYTCRSRWHDWFTFFHKPLSNGSPSQVGGWWGFPAACPLGGAFALYGEFSLHMHMCSPDLMKEIAPVEGKIALFKSPIMPHFYQPGRVGMTLIAA